MRNDVEVSSLFLKECSKVSVFFTSFSACIRNSSPSLVATMPEDVLENKVRPNSLSRFLINRLMFG